MVVNAYCQKCSSNCIDIENINEDNKMSSDKGMLLKSKCELCEESEVKALFCDRVTTGTVRLCSPWVRPKWPLKPTIQPGFCVRMTKRGSKTWNNNTRNSSLKSQNLKVFSPY